MNEASDTQALRRTAYPPATQKRHTVIPRIASVKSRQGAVGHWIGHWIHDGEA